MPSSRATVLVVDDKAEMAEMIAESLEERGLRATACASAPKAVEILAREPIDVLLTDLRMPGVDGIGLLAASKESDPDRPVIVMTGFGAIESAVECIRQGAFHYLTKPFSTDELLLFLHRALEHRKLKTESRTLKRVLSTFPGHAKLLGKSKVTLELLESVRRVADSSTPVLVLGETGTGKNVVAQALHDESGRAGPFVTVNCAALPEPLLESELFGHVKGAFTGAVANKAGLFAEAQGGTLLLDEIGDMSIPLQAKLLDVLSRGVVRPVGGTKERKVDVRILAATHRHLRERMNDDLFREDLYYRLSVVTLQVPALRNRPDDLPVLIDHFFDKSRREHAKSPAVSIHRDAMALLLAYGWPGNIRELSHVLERTVLLARAAEITVRDLPDEIVRGARSSSLVFRGEIVPLREVQRQYALWAYDELGRHRARASDRLGVDPKTLDRLLGGTE